MTNKTNNQRNKTCILAPYRVDACANCSHICGHRVALHGIDGAGGYVGQANVPRDYRHTTLSNSPVRADQPRAYTMADRYADTFKRHIDGGERAKSLYLWSESPGTGKTTTAVALLNAWISTEYLTALREGRQPKQQSAYFLDVNALQTQYNLATMTKDEREIERIGATIKRLQSVDFAVLDDIGVRSASEAFMAYVHAIINARTTAGLPTVFTSNLPVDEMADVFTERLYDRMRDQCVTIHFDGESKRGMR